MTKYLGFVADACLNFLLWWSKMRKRRRRRNKIVATQDTENIEDMLLKEGLEEWKKREEANGDTFTAKALTAWSILHILKKFELEEYR